jgi:hypothetical protein
MSIDRVFDPEKHDHSSVKSDQIPARGTARGEVIRGF